MREDELSNPRMITRHLSIYLRDIGNDTYKINLSGDTWLGINPCIRPGIIFWVALRVLISLDTWPDTWADSHPCTSSSVGIMRIVHGGVFLVQDVRLSLFIKDLYSFWAGSLLDTLKY